VFGVNLRKKSEPSWEGKKKGKIFSIQPSDELYNKLDEISKRYGIPKSQLMRDALIEKINRLDKCRSGRHQDSDKRIRKEPRGVLYIS
jgi:predicted DNA-binding protein